MFSYLNTNNLDLIRKICECDVYEYTFANGIPQGLTVTGTATPQGYESKEFQSNVVITAGSQLTGFKLRPDAVEALEVEFLDITTAGTFKGGFKDATGSNLMSIEFNGSAVTQRNKRDGVESTNKLYNSPYAYTPYSNYHNIVCGMMVFGQDKSTLSHFEHFWKRLDTNMPYDKVMNFFISAEGLDVRIKKAVVRVYWRNYPRK